MSCVIPIEFISACTKPKDFLLIGHMLMPCEKIDAPN